MTTALSALRLLLGRAVGAYFAGTTSATGTTSALIDAAGASNLLSYPDGYWDDGYVRITSGAADGDVRKIATFTQSTGTIVPRGVFSAAIAASVTYELYKSFNPTTELDQAIIDVVSQRQLYPVLHRNYEYDNHVSGSRLLNGSFEDWALTTIPDSWTAGSNLTVSKDTTAPWHGAASAKLVAAVATTFYQRQSLAAAIGTWALLDDYEITFYIWAKAVAASIVRPYIISGGTTTYGDYHTGGGGWERLYVSATITPTGVIDFGVAQGISTIFLDNAYFLGGPAVYEYSIPSAIQIERNAIEVEIQDNADNPKGRYTRVEPINYDIIPQTDGTRLLRFHQRPSDGHGIRIRGMGHLTALSAQTDTIEIDAPQTELVIAQAAVNLYLRGQEGDKQMDEATQANKLAQWQQRLAMMKAQFGMGTPSRSHVSRRW